MSWYTHGARLAPPGDGSGPGNDEGFCEPMKERRPRIAVEVVGRIGVRDLAPVLVLPQ